MTSPARVSGREVRQNGVAFHISDHSDPFDVTFVEPLPKMKKKSVGFVRGTLKARGELLRRAVRQTRSIPAVPTCAVSTCAGRRVPHLCAPRVYWAAVTDVSSASDASPVPSSPFELSLDRGTSDSSSADVSGAAESAGSSSGPFWYCSSIFGKAV